MAIITFLDGDGGNSPDQGLPGYGRPDNSLPGGGGPTDPGYGRPSFGGRPDNSLPGTWPPGIATLPVFPFDPTLPDNTLPGQPTYPTGGGGTPGYDLPKPGRKYVVKWLACYGFILVPDNSLPGGPPPVGPGSPALPGQGLPGGPPPVGPGSPNLPGQGLPPVPPPTGGQELPETPEPK